MDSTIIYAATTLTVSGGPIRLISVSVNPYLVGEITVEMRADDRNETEAVSVRRMMGRLVVKVPSRRKGRKPRKSFLDRIVGLAKDVNADRESGLGDDESDYPSTLDLRVLVPLNCPVRLKLSSETLATVEDGIRTLRLESPRRAR